MPKKILIIDDEPEILQVVGQRLKAAGYEIVFAMNGEEGLRQVVAQKPDLIVLDVLMPVMDGFEFFKTLRKDPRQADLPIVVLTARGSMRDTFEILDADAFIPKPFDSAKLLETINLLISKRVLLLSDDPYVIDVVTKAFETIGLAVDPVGDEATLIRQGAANKYKVVVAHLPMLEKAPGDFLGILPRLRYKRPRVIVYCDAHVRTTEQNDSLAIDAIQTEWRRAGIAEFYDARVSPGSFVDMVKEWLQIRS